MQKVLYILGQLNDADVEWLSDEGERRKYASGSRLIEQGVPNDDLFIVLQGFVSVVVEGLGELHVLGSGEILGEMSLVDSRPPSATVVAQDDVYVLSLNFETLRRQVESDLGFGMRFYRALATFLSQRLRNERTPDFTQEIGLLPGQEQDGELDAYVLDNVQVAGARFDRLLKKMMSGSPGGGGWG